MGDTPYVNSDLDCLSYAKPHKDSTPQKVYLCPSAHVTASIEEIHTKQARAQSAVYSGAPLNRLYMIDDICTRCASFSF